MDSITQAVVGAVVGELTLSKHIGWRGAVWGAIWGTVPDLDILALPFFDSAERLSWHRGISHSLLLCLLMPIPIATQLRLRRKRRPPWSAALLFGFLVWSTHIAVDCFNAYSTQIFEPFSSARVSLDLFFIIDPLFTLPMLLGLLAIPLLRHRPRARRWAVTGGTGISLAVLLFAVFAHQRSLGQWHEQLQQQGHVVSAVRSLPTPLNTLYRRCLARCEGGYLIGYLSILDGDGPIPIRFIPDGHQDLPPQLQGSPAVTAVAHFSEGWWIHRQEAEGSILADLRFFDRWMGMPGHEDGAEAQGWRYRVDESGTELQRRRRDMGRPGEILTFILSRMWGRLPATTSP